LKKREEKIRIRLLSNRWRDQRGWFVAARRTSKGASILPENCVGDGGGPAGKFEFLQKGPQFRGGEGTRLKDRGGEKRPPKRRFFKP